MSPSPSSSLHPPPPLPGRLAFERNYAPGPDGAGDVHGRRPLLLVEDDPLVRQVVAAGLRDHGYAVAEAESAEEALLYLHRAMRDGGLGLVVTDINLGDGRNGIELAAQMRTIAPELGVVFVTGRTEWFIGRAPGRRDAFLEKPFRLGTLVAMIAGLMGSPSDDRMTG